jgi:fucose 4-O-acetylase-like acetyltransferase
LFVRKRAERLLIPWLFWSGVYAICLVYRSHRIEQSLGEMFGWHTLVSGTYDHLWFLPFIFVAGVAVHLLHRATYRLSLAWQVRWRRWGGI